MRLRWTGLRGPSLPEGAAVAIGDDKAMGWAQDRSSGQIVVAGATKLYAVAPDGSVALARPWHLVDGGSWDQDSSTLRVTWVDRAPTNRWTFPLDSEFPVVFRARVQASVVLHEQLDFGDHRTARVVVRKDLSDGHLLTQSILGKGVRSTDPGVREALDEVLADLKEQVGLD